MNLDTQRAVENLGPSADENVIVLLRVVAELNKELDLTRSVLVWITRNVPPQFKGYINIEIPVWVTELMDRHFPAELEGTRGWWGGPVLRHATKWEKFRRDTLHWENWSDIPRGSSTAEVFFGGGES